MSSQIKNKIKKGVFTLNIDPMVTLITEIDICRLHNVITTKRLNYKYIDHDEMLLKRNGHDYSYM